MQVVDTHLDLKTYEHELEGSVERISVFGCQITRRPLLIFAGMMKKRAKWFSWFLEGPAKATWQRTLANHRGMSLMVINYKHIPRTVWGTHGPTYGILSLP